MATTNISQKWSCENEISILLEKTQEVSDFPDPASLYALYRVIIHKEPMNKMVAYPFVAFRGRAVEEYIPTTYGERAERKDYSFWISTLVAFLGGPSLVEYNSDRERTVQLTHFGNHIFPHLMKAFVELYRQTDVLREAAAAYQSLASKKGKA